MSVSLAYGQTIGTATIRAPAVLVSNNTGSLTTFTLVVTRGDGSVTIRGPSEVGNDTLQSAFTAAHYATKYLNMNFSNYNFNYTISDSSDNVSGPSGGAAMTMLAISALSGRHLLSNFTMTGTISPNGTIGPIGGVYDKVSAAKADNLSFVLVPQVGAGSLDNELYLLVQDTFQIPLIEVPNVSRASVFAFGRSNLSANLTSYQFYTPLDLSVLPKAPYSCSNNCNVSQFKILTNATFYLTTRAIGSITNQRFANVSMQLTQALNQSTALADKGYLYAGANLAFQNYADAFMFNNYRTTNKTIGLETLQNVLSFCGSEAPPQLTTSNYELVMGGELRQSWALFTANGSITLYNSTVETTDDILSYMKRAANVNAWCEASGVMYALANQTQGADVVPSQSLQSIALQRLSRASAYGENLYYATAQEAYQENNYPLAILDADYGYAIANATQANMTTSQLLNASSTLAANATYGLWSTQYANEAYMYITEAKAVNNQTQDHAFAESAYSSALLAYQMSNDTRLIYQNLVPGSGKPQITIPKPSPIPTSTATSTPVPLIVTPGSGNSGLSQATFDLVVAMFVVNVVFMGLIIYLLLPISTRARMELRAQKQQNARRRK